MPRDGFYFRSKWSISQQGVDFAVEGHFRSPFRSCEMRLEGCEIALVCQGVVSQLWNHLRNGGMAAKIGVFKLWGFRSCEIQGGLRNGTHVSRGCFAEGVHGAAKSFRSGGLISQLRGDFAGAHFGLRNFADHGFFLAFELLLIPRDLSSISLQFLLN